MSILLLAMFLGAHASYDSHNDVPRGNTFLATAAVFAQAKGYNSCWVCGLLPTSSDTYPYMAIPFTLIDYVVAYNNHMSSFYRENITFYERPITDYPPEQVKISYAPKGLLCWVSNPELDSVVLGQSICDFYVSTGQISTRITWHNNNETLILPNHVRAAMNGTMFVCGKYAYTQLPEKWSGACYLAYVVPAMRVTRSHPRTRKAKRDLFHSKEVVASPTQRFFSAIIPNYGVTVALDEIRQVAHVMEKIANDTAGAFLSINKELYSIRQMVLQNRMALDIILADRGGTCGVIQAQCCTYIPDVRNNVTAYVNDIYKQVATLKEPPSWNLDAWLKSWGGTSLAYFIQILMPFLIPVICICIVVRTIIFFTQRMCKNPNTAIRLAPMSTTKSLGPDNHLILTF